MCMRVFGKTKGSGQHGEEEEEEEEERKKERKKETLNILFWDIVSI